MSDLQTYLLTFLSADMADLVLGCITILVVIGLLKIVAFFFVK